MKPYVIGIDFGTLSGRAILLDTRSGTELAESILPYAHAVMDEKLPCGKKLPPLYALQHPQDYLEVLQTTVPDVLRKAGVPAEQVAGIGIDFTSCTVLPVDQEGTPLCMKPGYAQEPHAYVKLWKHHAAQPYADEINRLSQERNESWLPMYGGKTSCEWLLPKLLEILREAPDIYGQTARFLEAGDWLSWMLTGDESRSVAFAGYKALWNAENGYPSDDFLTTLDPALHGAVGTVIGSNVQRIAESAGVISQRGSALTSLLPGTPVAIPTIDAHAAMPALNITGTGELMLVLGTSSCHIINADVQNNVPGICGYVKDAVIPGLYTYEAGQACVGDSFDWFVRSCVPGAYTWEAEEKGITIHQLLQEKAQDLKPGENGLVALDWLNGNRSVLVDSDLSGVLVGMTLRTRPEEIYRAFLEATAYGTRMIIEQYERSGISINSICAAGGIAQKNAMMMQIYADVTGRPIRIAGTTQASALGSAIYASVAGGLFPTVAEAAAKLSRPDKQIYHPIAENGPAYDKLYGIYKTLHDYFGRENPDLLHALNPRT